MKSTDSSKRQQRHVPERTCLGCRQVRDKRELVRVVRTPEGEVEADVTGKKAGRGTYLCPRRECWDAGLKGNRLDYVLHTTVSGKNREQLRKYAEEQIQGAMSGASE
jgi:predicted RNA-binding protein YlxR (DUF448 family)